MFQILTAWASKETNAMSTKSNFAPDKQDVFTP